MDLYQNGIIKSDGEPFAAAGPQREDTFSVRVYVKWMVKVNGSYQMDSNFTEIKNPWDKKSGGEIDSEETTYNPGEMADRISLGGRVIPGNITLSRIFRGYDQDLLPKWYEAVGVSDVQVVEQGWDLDGNKYGNNIVYLGKLKKVTPPPRDSMGTGAAMIEIEITLNGSPTA